jgi:DNA adenine methylase
MKKTRSFLKWAGNKYNCLNHILPAFPDSDLLIEPFAGSGTVFINTEYKNNILAEENEDLITLFKCIQLEGLEFIEYCESFFSKKNNEKSQYYSFRDKFNQITEPKARAAIFLYLNRHGYNGLCRYNNSGKYNVPFGTYDKPYFPKDEMMRFHIKSKDAKFIHADFLETVKQAKSGDFIYCDPPYAPIGQQTNFSSYTSKKFGEKEHILLAEAAKNAANNGVKVIISNHDTEFTRQLYLGAEIKSFPVSRLINCNTNHRVPAQELIAVF